MHSLTTPSRSSPFSPRSLLHLTPSIFPSLFSPLGSTTRSRIPVRRFNSLSLGSLRNGNSHKGLCFSVFLKRCKDWDNNIEGDSSSLEAEILEFMQNSKNPEAFPTREELVAAGRVDLVESIVKEGGWLTYGWDLNKGCQEIKDFEDGRGSEIDGNATWASGVASSSSSSSANSSQPARTVNELEFSYGGIRGAREQSPLNSNQEIEAGESGIEGILNRLEKERNSSFGLGSRDQEDSMSSENNEDKDQWDHRTTMDEVAADLENSSRPSTLSPTSNHCSGFQIKLDQHRSQLSSDELRNSLKPAMWRTWITQRTGFSDADFEDGEIAPSETLKGGLSDVSGQPDILKIREFSGEPVNRETRLGSLDKNANHNDIKSCILHLESELSSVLHSLRSSTDKVTRQTDQNSSSDDISKISDAWEFQENEIMNAQDRLRSIRAKLAVLEGKMTLTIMDAHKVVEEKQRKINNAQRALRLLKTTSVVWPNTASEVFLAGSFDGWSTQRKMERSSTGIFSVCLQLYPGKYEIKFIVDGEWKIDPLRPIVKNNGYENNLLVIHE